MKLERTVLNQETREKPRSSFRAYASAAVLAAGLAIVASCATAKQKPVVAPQPVQTVAEASGKTDFCASPKNIPSSVKTVRQADGTSIAYRTDRVLVKKGDKVEMSDPAEGRFYGKVVKITDKSVRLSFDKRTWSVNYRGSGSRGEFLAITITAQNCSKDTALLTVTYPIGEKAEPSKK